jgi:hypothetical protein
MATRSTSRNNLIGFESLSFIRAQTISFKVSDVKPLTRFYAYFDGVNVNEFIQPGDAALGDPLMSDASGKFEGQFFLPNNTFNTGKRTFKILDSDVFDTEIIAGSLVSSATADFTATGFKSTYQKTIENVVTNRVTQQIVTWGPADPTPVRPPGDPLAQTFFTYGIKGGCFITGVEVYFQSKDASIPVRLEVREVVNGYPSPNYVEELSAVTLEPSSVNISNDASLGTTFVFLNPIYLKQDRDYCFVLLSNSNSYNVWTSELGAKSVETGKVIAEQPFVGSLFKSENNITWTAEQTQDIKFNIYRAKFDTTSPVSLTMRAKAPDDNIHGRYFSVVSGSSVVTAKLPMQHGFSTGDLIVLRGKTGANYRGIPAAIISNTNGFGVTRIDDYSFSFNLGSGNNAISTGTLESTGKVEALEIDVSGINYGSPTLTFAGDGTGAAGSVSVDAGQIVGVTITNPGSGYTKAPIVTIVDATGQNAKIVAISDAVFATSINRRFQAARPILKTFLPVDTEMSATLRTTSETNVVGLHKDFSLSETTIVDESVVANSKNELQFFGGTATLEMVMNLSSTNSNVSPMVDLRALPRIALENNVVNDIFSSNATTYDPASELDATGGEAYARYISQPFQLETISKGARVIVTAASIETTYFNVYFRSSLAGSTVPHKTNPWVLMECPVERNLSRSLGEYKDYEFTIDDLDGFDVYDIKIVLSSANKKYYPVIDQYRTIIIAT